MKNKKFNSASPPQGSKGFVAGCLVTAVLTLAMQPTNAAVGDNLDSAFTVLADWLGMNKEDNVPLEDEFETASLVEKVNYLERRVNVVDNKIDQQTEELLESIDTGIVAATAPYNLYVYFPKDEALSDYTDEVVSIISNTGNQVATSKLKDDGVNYSTKIYFDFAGDCTLKYNLINSNKDKIAAVLPINIDKTGLEQNLNLPPKDLAWETIHNILQSNSAEDFKLSVAGTELPGSCFVQGATTDNEGNYALKLWKRASIGSGSYSGSCSIASNYKATLNSAAGCDIAYSSRIIEYNEVNTNLRCNFWIVYHNNDYYYYSYEGYPRRSNTIIDGRNAVFPVFPIVYIH